MRLYWVYSDDEAATVSLRGQDDRDNRRGYMVYLFASGHPTVATAWSWQVRSYRLCDVVCPACLGRLESAPITECSRTVAAKAALEWLQNRVRQERLGNPWDPFSLFLGQFPVPLGDEGGPVR